MNKLRVILKSTLQAKLSNELIMKIESRIESNRSSWHVANRNANYTINDMMVEKTVEIYENYAGNA